MQPDPEKTEKNPGEGEKTFKQLPEEDQESLLLKEEAEKTAGKERADINHEIQRRSPQAKP